jgi:hypothetical protein
MGCKTKKFARIKNGKRFEDLVDLLRKNVDMEGIAEWIEIDLHSKKLDLMAYIELIIWSAIKDCEKLRELSDGSKGIDAKKDGLIQISSSQLSKVNKTRDYRVFVLTFYELIYGMRKYHILWRFRKELKLLGIDSSFIKINRDFAKLGYCSSTKSIEKGIKIHLAALLGKLTLPITAMITPGDVSDQKEFDYLLEDCSVMIDLTKVILVFDKGYWNFDRFADLTEKGIKFITLMKKGTVYEVLSEKNWKNISDKRIRLSNGLELRLIQIKTEDGIGEYLTNIFDLSAMDIVHAYEQRWIIEIFFREIKSYFKIDHFMSKNLNGMLIQIFCTLTAYALMVLFRVIYDLYWISILEIKRYLKYNIIEGNLHGLKCSNNAIV